MGRIRTVAAVLLLAFISACGGTYSPSPSSPSTSSPSPSPAPTPSPTPTPTPGTAGSTVTIPTNARALGAGAFVPNPDTVAQGAAVTWTNTDTTTHDIVSDTGVWNSGTLGPNGTFNFTFAARGSYPYHCSIHPTMTGTIVVQ